MSIEPNAHEAQMKIMRQLLFVRSARFAELQKATGLTSDHFNFHVSKLSTNGLIVKTADGYELTRDGKEYANRMDTDENVIEVQPKISVALIIENEAGRFLAQQRLKQPYFGFWGRPTGKIRRGETFEAAGARELLEETGLTADLSVAGFYHKMDYDESNGELLDDKLFVLIYGTHPSGELIVDGEGHHNEWLSDDEINTKDKCFESVATITQMARSGTMKYMEKSYYYSTKEY